jgi:excisionase family DNA binding protein
VGVIQVSMRNELRKREALLSRKPPELTTRDAADLINVSEEYLVALLDSDAIPSCKVGTCHRVLFEHVRAYKKSEETKRLTVLTDLVREAQELSLGY